MGRASCWRTNVRLSMKPSPLIWLSSTFSEKRDHVEAPIWSFVLLLEMNLPSYEYVSYWVERISVDILRSHFARRHWRRMPRRSCASSIVLDRVDFAPVNEVVSLCIPRNLDCSRAERTMMKKRRTVDVFLRRHYRLPRVQWFDLVGRRACRYRLPQSMKCKISEIGGSFVANFSHRAMPLSVTNLVMWPDMSRQDDRYHYDIHRASTVRLTVWRRHPLESMSGAGDRESYVPMFRNSKTRWQTILKISVDGDTILRRTQSLLHRRSSINTCSTRQFVCWENNLLREKATHSDPR